MRKILYIFGFLLIFLVTKGVVAQSPTVKWWYDTFDSSFGQSASADIDNDGKLEIVFGCYRNDGNVYALNSEDGSLLWKYNTHAVGYEGCNDAAPLIYDVDNDGSLEVIVAASCNSKTFCFDGATGELKWVCNSRGSDSPPTVADIDNDGKPEILHGEFGGYLLCINGEDGTQSWEILVDPNSWIQTAPTIVDLDNNGQLDFVIGTWNFNQQSGVYAYRGDNHSLLWTYPIPDYIYHGTAVADLDKDGKPELVLGGYNDKLYCFEGENGTIKWTYSATGGYIGAPVSIGDIDNDGDCEVILVSGYIVTVLSKDGIPKWHYNIPGYEGSFRGAILADINNDPYLDVIFGTDGGKLTALNGNNGSQIWSKDLAAHYGNPEFGFDNAPLVADFDNDGLLDIFVVGGYSEYPEFQNGFGRAYMLSIGAGNGPDWLMFQREIWRQSSVCDNFPLFVNETNVIKSKVIFFPNPSQSSITFQFPNSDNNPLTLIIYNALGQTVQKFENIAGSEIRVKTNEWSPGLYYFRLQNKTKIIGQDKFIINPD